MDLEGCKLESVKIVFFGFAGHTLYPDGDKIPLTVEAEYLRKIVMESFTMVDDLSLYNIILGRPALNDLMAVASTYHQKIKFHMGSRIGKVQRYQASSQKCYAEIQDSPKDQLESFSSRKYPGPISLKTLECF